MLEITGKEIFTEASICSDIWSRRFVYIDDVADRVRKLKARYEEAAGDSSLQLFLCEQFMEEILN